tara:strand:- start:704 stop:910 length:207 start_codon:yes stop_codon:yes gene_type:complete
MGIIGKLLGVGASFLPFKKGGKVKKMANGGAVQLDSQDKKAITTLVNRAEKAGVVAMRRGGKVRKPRK